MLLSPAGLPSRDLYRLAIGAVLPRPIAWVSSVDEQGRPNLAPFSFFTVVASDPLTLVFCPQAKGDGVKDTLANIQSVPAFVIHAVGEAQVVAMSRSSADLPRGESEFAYAGVTPVDSTHVPVPRVAEAPIAFECRLAAIHRFGNGSAVFGEVVAIHVDDALYQDGRIDTQALAPVGRMAGDAYVRCTDRFTLVRG